MKVGLTRIVVACGVLLTLPASCVQLRSNAEPSTLANAAGERYSLALAGGGFGSVVMQTAVIGAGLHVKGSTGLEDLFSKIDAISSASGGAWQAALMFYSPGFVQAMEEMGRSPESSADLFQSGYTEKLIEAAYVSLKQRKSLLETDGDPWKSVGNFFANGAKTLEKTIVDKTREGVDDVVNGAKTIVDKTREGVDDVANGAKTIVDKTREGVDDVVNGAKTIVDKTREGVNDVIDQTREGIENAGDHAMAALAGAKDSVQLFLDKALTGVADLALDEIHSDDKLRGFLPTIHTLLNIGATLKERLNGAAWATATLSLFAPVIPNLGSLTLGSSSNAWCDGKTYINGISVTTTDITSGVVFAQNHFGTSPGQIRLYAKEFPDGIGGEGVPKHLPLPLSTILSGPSNDKAPTLATMPLAPCSEWVSMIKRQVRAVDLSSKPAQNHTYDAVDGCTALSKIPPNRISLSYAVAASSAFIGSLGQLNALKDALAKEAGTNFVLQGLLDIVNNIFNSIQNVTSGLSVYLATGADSEPFAKALEIQAEAASNLVAAAENAGKFDVLPVMDAGYDDDGGISNLVRNGATNILTIQNLGPRSSVVDLMARLSDFNSSKYVSILDKMKTHIPIFKETVADLERATKEVAITEDSHCGACAPPVLSVGDLQGCGGKSTKSECEQVSFPGCTWNAYLPESLRGGQIELTTMKSDWFDIEEGRKVSVHFIAGAPGLGSADFNTYAMQVGCITHVLTATEVGKRFAQDFWP